MIRSKRGLILTGVLTFFAALLIMFPARVAVHALAPPDVLVRGIEGTIWHGSAAEASVTGLYLSSIEWDIHPLALLTGKLSYSLSATPVGGIFDADASLGFGGSLAFSNLTAAVPLAMFAESIDVQGLTGDASLNFERLELTDGIATHANGTLKVANMIVPLLGRNSLGGYQAEFYTQNNGVSASVEDTDGVVDLAGVLQINADRSYEFVAQIIAKPDTPPNIRQQLQFLPPPDERGQQEIRLEGIL